MKRLTGRFLVATGIVVLTGAVIALFLWTTATTKGTRWLLEAIAPLVGVSFSAQKIEGRILDHLLISEMRITLDRQKIEIDTVELHWKPLLLLTGTVAVREMVIKGMRIQDDDPPDNRPPLHAWPAVSANAQLFDGVISKLLVTDISYRRLQEQPLPVTSLAATVDWHDAGISFRNLKAVSPSGRLSGSVSAGFKHPSLRADLAIIPVQPLAGMSSFSLQACKSSGAESGQFIGNITVTGSAGGHQLLELSGDAGTERNIFTLRGLRFSEANQKGLLTGEGTLTLTGREPLLSLQIKTVDLNLAPRLNVSTNLSGTLTFTGTADSYRGAFSLTNRAHGWQAGAVTATYHGTRTGMQLTPLTVTLLDGSLAGKLDMNWVDGFSLQGAIHGRNLNLAGIVPDWKGVANFDVNGSAVRSEKVPLTASISGTLLESRLHGQALTGQLQADIVGKNITFERLMLSGKGFDLHASGDLSRRLVMAAQISDVSQLVPRSSGTLKADGWVRRVDGQLSGSVNGTGSKLEYGGVRLASADFVASLRQNSINPLHVVASLRDVFYDGHALNSVTVAAEGTMLLHRVNVTLRSARADARLSVSAGYTPAVWQGEVSRLSGSDGNGPWQLSSPTAFYVSADKLSLSPLTITAGATERLEIAADLALHPLSGRIQAQLADVDLTRIRPWLPAESILAGRISGQATGIMLPGSRFELDGGGVLGAATLHRKMAEGDLNLTLTRATASVGWRGESLTGVFDMSSAEYGQIRANVQLPIAARFPAAVNPQGPLRASLSAKLQEKRIIAALFPGLVQESSGELDAELGITGTWKAPQIRGNLKLAKAGAYLPTAGIHLRDIQLTAHLEDKLIRVDSFRALSGGGHIGGTALITLADWRVISYRGIINGENFPIVAFPELHILSTPKLTFEGTPDKFTMRGDVHLPELNIVGAPLRTVIAPSSDVIREGLVVPAAKISPLLMDVQLRLLLGERVFIKTVGIDAQLGGVVELSMSTLDKINGRGEIKVLKGRYRTYGANLEIVRGRLFFAGGFIDRPTLDFLALRTIGNVRAGVIVSGTLQKPVTKLYSEPAMPDIDILACIVLGHPLGSNGAQASILAQAAGALLSTSQAGALQEQIKNRFGLSTLEIQGGVGESAGSMGYKPLQVTPPGATPASQQFGITETVLTVGKYVTPELYISYGKSLFTGSNLFRLRYDIFKKWQIETQTGSGESGADIYYKLEW